MPGPRVHGYVDRKLFGKAYWKVHFRMDLPWRWLGRNHRVLFHDFPTAVAIAREYYPNDYNAQRAALLHIHLDTLCTQDPVFKKQLELLADADIRRRRKGKKKRRKSSKEDAFLWWLRNHV